MLSTKPDPDDFDPMSAIRCGAARSSPMDELTAAASILYPTVPNIEAATSTAFKGTKPRDPWLHNARLLAAVLIVVLHFSAALRAHSEALNALIFATWPMQVPLYVLIAGYFSSTKP